MAVPRSAEPARFPIYLDYQATTPTDLRVVEAMRPYFFAEFGNPHSTSHRHGARAREAVEEARAMVAALIGAEAREIVFTSGATESNNLAIKGAVRFARSHSSPPRDHVVTVVTEHKCVLESCRRLEREGTAVTYLPVRDTGLIDLDRLADALTDRTALVSIMAVNNEIGVIQPLAEIGRLTRARGVLFHTDAAQAVGKIPLAVDDLGIDLLSLSGHKMYGPKGVGALYVRHRPRARLEPLFDGGGQERGLRSGTLPTPLCVGLGEACRIARGEMATEGARLLALREHLIDRVLAIAPGATLNGDRARRVPGNANIAFPGIDAEELLARLPGLSLSTGSACTSAEVAPSYVLGALGLREDLARASIRIGLGRFTTAEEVEEAVAQIGVAVTALLAGTQPGLALTE